MAYFRIGSTYRFVEASIDQSGDRDRIAITSLTTWRRRWRQCSATLPAGFPRRRLGGTLKSNEPCGALPIEATYAVTIEMGGAEGRVRYSHVVGWQFADSGPFAEFGMAKIAEATCGYLRPTITCTDSTGDSFRYTYG